MESGQQLQFLKFDDGMNWQKVFTPPYELEDLDLIGDPLFAIGVPFASSLEFKRKVFAAGKAHVLGLRSIDYTLKRYGDTWKFTGFTTDRDAKITFEMTSAVKQSIRSAEGLRSSLKGKLLHQGLFAADAALVRLNSTFRVAIFTTRNGFHFETSALGRMILEQLAWIHAIYKQDLSFVEFLKINPQSCIGSLKELFSYAGMLYGRLSEACSAPLKVNRAYAAWGS